MSSMSCSGSVAIVTRGEMGGAKHRDDWAGRDGPRDGRRMAAD